MGIPKDILREHEIFKWNILLAYRGSIAHGMYVPSSDPNSIDDKDVMGICVPPLEYYYGLKTFGIHKGTKEIKRDEWDIVIYEARKAVRLLEGGNPNVLTLLWCEPNHYLHLGEAGQLLRTHRSYFVGRHVYKSFTGYAYGQLKRMTHYKFEGYMGEKRKALVDEFGYDTKNAAHLIRLLRMGIEFLKDGVLYVHRHDAQQLLAIKRGEWELKRVQDEADRLFKVAEETYLASDLPVRPDHDTVSRLCMDVVETALNGR